MNQKALSVDEILEKLNDNLALAPGITTDIGWEVWAEDKQEYYNQAKAQLATMIEQYFAEVIGPVFDEFEYGNPPFANEQSKIQAKAFRDYIEERQRQRAAAIVEGLRG